MAASLLWHIGICLPVSPAGLRHQSLPDNDGLLGDIHHIEVLCNVETPLWVVAPDVRDDSRATGIVHLQQAVM